MKLSNDTLNILKNFATINSSIYFKRGNVIETVSNLKTILAKAEIKDTLPCDFGIYDLNKFLSVVSMYKETPDFDIENNDVIIQGINGRSRIKYRTCAKELIVTPPDKNVNMTGSEIRFNLTLEDFEWLMKSANVLQSPNISISSDGNNIIAGSFDAKNDAENVNSITIAKGNGDVYNMIFKTENLKLIPGSYDVIISAKGIAHFSNTQQKIEYWVMTENGSKFQGAN